MVTIFSIPLESNSEAIQNRRTNAINSWRRILPKCEIILCGGGGNIAAFAQTNGARHFSDIPVSEFGTPLLSGVFELVQNEARGDILMYSNSDMLFFDDLHDAIAAVPFEKYLLSGRRWDLDLEGTVAMDDSEGWKKLRGRHGRDGSMHGPGGLDFFIFPRSMRIRMPGMVVGRPGWDSWFVWYMRSKNIAVIDGTNAVTAIHQNHDRSHLKLGPKQYTGPEMRINIQLAGGYMNMLGLREADWVFSEGRVVRPRMLARFISTLAPSWPYRFVFAVKRHLQRSTGKIREGLLAYLKNMTCKIRKR